MKSGFKVIDSDMHLREPAELWDKYMEPEWHDQAPRISKKQWTGKGWT